MQSIAKMFEGKDSTLFKNYQKAIKKDEPLDKLLEAINTSRKEVNLKPYTYPRLVKDLQKLGASKKNWDRNILIGEILDRENPSKYFGWLLKELKQ